MKALKKCPFCGKTPVLMSKEWFTNLEKAGDTGTACITIECSTCHMIMYGHTTEIEDRAHIHDYDFRVNRLIEKWNGRVFDVG